MANIHLGRFSVVACSVLALWGIPSPAPAQSSAPPRALLYAGWFGNTIPTPSFVRDNRAFLETQPFDGLILYLRDASATVNVTTGIMSGSPVSASTIANVLAPVRGLPFTTLAHNFGLVFVTTPPDFFDDWSVVVRNFSALAQSLRDAGLRGVCLDNEQYFKNWGNYPEGVKYPARTLREYQDQARLRGREMMQAMTGVFPEITVLTLHGPYVSEPKAPAALLFPQWQASNELLGPLFAGFMEGAGGTATNADGGELYNLRSASQFDASYGWRRNDLPSATVNCAFIPTTLRPLWPGRSSISFGVYDRPFGGAAMDPSILRPTIANALRRADRYVWFYTEGATFLKPATQGGAATDWVNAVRQGRLDALSSLAPAAPSNLSATAVSTSEIDLGWADRSADETGFRIERKTGTAGTWGVLATVAANVSSYSDLGLPAGTGFTYRVRSTGSSGDSSPSNEATAATLGATPPPTPSPTPPPSNPPPGTGGGGSGGGRCGLVGLDAGILVLCLLRRSRRP